MYICYLKENYNLVNADEFYYLVEKGKISENDCCVTFDDGIKSQFDIALPVLIKMNIQAFFFISHCGVGITPSPLGDTLVLYDYDVQKRIP